MWSAWLPVAAYATLIFTLSTIPRLLPDGGPSHLDKLAHFAEYSVLGGLLVRAWGRTLTGRAGWRIGLSVGLGLVIAAADEWVQGTVGRDRSLADGLTDLSAVTAAVLIDAWDRRRARPTHWLWQQPERSNDA